MSGLRLAPWATLTPTSAGAVLRSDLGALHLGGADAQAFVEQVVPLLDGTRDLASIAAALPSFSSGSVAALIDALAARGLVVEAESANALDGAFLRAFPGDPALMRARLAEARVIGVGSARWLGSALRSLRSSGIGAVTRAGVDAVEAALAASGPTTLLLAAVPPGDRAAVERVSRAAHRTGVRSLWAHLAGTAAVIGPLVIPGQTACRVCALAELNDLGAIGSRAVRPSARAAREAALGHVVALAAIQLCAEAAPTRLGGRALVQDGAAWESSLHAFVRVPWCRVCG